MTTWTCSCGLARFWNGSCPTCGDAMPTVSPSCPVCGGLTIPTTMPESDPSKDYWACAATCGIFATEKRPEKGSR